MASIINFENIAWEKLYWFLKFLVPKLKVQDPMDEFDEILDAVDLSSYGLARTKLNYSIKLDDEETELDPQNPNPRGTHGEDKEKIRLMKLFVYLTKDGFKIERNAG